MQKILFTLIFNSISLLICGQSVADVLLLADYQYKSGNYEVALKEYERYLFFEPSSNAFIFSEVADCYWNLKQYNQAIEFYDKAFFSSIADSQRYRSLFRKVDCYIRTGDFGLGLGDLLSISDSLQGSDYYMKEFYSGLCYYGMQDFTSAEPYFINAIDPAYPEQRDKIKQLFSNPKIFYRPNSQTALILSICLPGLGQLYAGDARNAANSILLTTLLAYLAIRIAITESIFDALITIAPWYQRYYQGGYTRAEQYAIQKRAEHRSKIFEKITGIVASTKEND